MAKSKLKAILESHVPANAVDVVQCCSLPIPPSANNLFFNNKAGAPGRGRIATPEYKSWIESASHEVSVQLKPFKPTVYPISVSIAIQVGPDLNRNRDVDNFMKPAVDLVKKCGIIKNDNLKHIEQVKVYANEIEGDSYILLVLFPHGQRTKTLAREVEEAVMDRGDLAVLDIAEGLSDAAKKIDCDPSREAFLEEVSNAIRTIVTNACQS